jgi:hypothetical protein
LQVTLTSLTSDSESTVSAAIRFSIILFTLASINPKSPQKHHMMIFSIYTDIVPTCLSRGFCS